MFGRKATFEAQIIETLKGRRMSAVQLCEHLKCWPWTIYPALYRLEKAGTLTSLWQDGPEPRRRMYFITPGRLATYG